MRFRLRTLMIVTAFAPAIVWAATLGLAALIELAGPHAYKAYDGTSRPPASKAAKRPSGLSPNKQAAEQMREDIKALAEKESSD